MLMPPAQAIGVPQLRLHHGLIQCFFQVLMSILMFYIFWKNIWQETASLTIESFCSTVHGILMQKLFVYIHKYLYLLFCNLLYKNFLKKCPAYIKIFLSQYLTHLIFSYSIANNPWVKSFKNMSVCSISSICV